IRLTLRTVGREVRDLRRELEAEARATIRFETPPGKQLQIDFGERRAMIGDENVKVDLLVATLGYSRGAFGRPFPDMGAAEAVAWGGGGELGGGGGGCVPSLRRGYRGGAARQ